MTQKFLIIFKNFLIEVFNISNSDCHLFFLCYFHFQMNFNLVQYVT